MILASPLLWTNCNVLFVEPTPKGNVYTSAQIGALGAPYFFFLGCVKRTSYMLIHVERTTISWLKTISCTLFEDS